MTSTVASAKPVVIQVISWTVAPTAPRSLGTATLTMDASMVPIRVPNVMDAVTSHLLTGGRRGGAAGRARRVTTGASVSAAAAMGTRAGLTLRHVRGARGGQGSALS